MTVYRDKVQIPSKPLQTDFTNDRFVRSYVRLFTQTGQYYRYTENAISRELYKDGCALIVFYLTPQMDSSEVGFELIKYGNIRIEIHFATATARTFTVIVFAEHDNLLEIDQDRNVLLYGMDTLQIERLLKKDLRTKNIFKKVCALDQLEKPTFPSGYVINSDPNNEPGEHWVAVYFEKRGRGEYFDSYRLSPTLIGLKSYMDAYSLSR